MNGVEQVVEAALAKARLASEGGAYITIDAQGARTAARRQPAGPLAGVPFAVKDLVAVAGQPLRAGSAVRQEASPEPEDAPVVAALRQAGAIFIGTTALHEFAFGVTGINDHTGTPLNPHDPARIPGGSSSGSAVAVAEGSAWIAVGTDTGGSVRIPAALCGVVGFKPAQGAYPMQGVFPLSPTLDHVGFLARSVAEIERIHQLFGPAVPDEIRPRRLGLLREELEQSEPAVQRRFDDLLQRLAKVQCAIVEVDWPGSAEILTTSTAIMFAEAAAVHRSELQRDASRYGADVQARLRQGVAIPAVEYIAALQSREQLRAHVLATLANVDGVVGPTVGLVAPTIVEARDPAVGGRLVAFTRLANVVGLPALSLPIPGDGLPVGLQVMAAGEAQLLGIGAFLERLLSSESGLRQRKQATALP
ncbi:MAG: amidase [Chloroflexi bacterium]|nr:amidase [Chloroflexota bacterium]MCI0727781.1 amidase [Chloroflexota bacterium]